MRGGFRLGRLAGVELRIDWGLLVVFALITLNLGAGVFPLWHPTWSASLSWLIAIAAALLFFASVLVHELSHALVARSFGTDTRAIRLFIFGGVAELRGESRSASAELWTALIGPVVSVVLGFIFMMLAALLMGPRMSGNPLVDLSHAGPLETLLLWLGPVNVVLGLFNMLPGFPLDGGRVLRAILWAGTGDALKATRWASAVGQLFGWLFIATGVAMMLGLRVAILGGGFLQGLWLTFLGWFLNSAAVASYASMVVRATLADLPVGRVMSTQVVKVQPDYTMDGLVDRMLHSDQRAFPVVDADDRLLGLVCLQDIRRTPRQDWPTTPVANVMTPRDQITAIRPEAEAVEAMRLLAELQVDQIPVVSGERVVGIVRRQDLLRWLELSPPARAPA